MALDEEGQDHKRTTSTLPRCGRLAHRTLLVHATGPRAEELNALVREGEAKAVAALCEDLAQIHSCEVPMGARAAGSSLSER